MHRGVQPRSTAAPSASVLQVKHSDSFPVHQAYRDLLRPRSAATTPFRLVDGTCLSNQDVDLPSRSNSSIPGTRTLVKRNWPTVGRRLLYTLARRTRQQIETRAADVLYNNRQAGVALPSP